MNLSKPTFPIIPNDINNTGYYTNCVQFLCRQGPVGLILPPQGQATPPSDWFQEEAFLITQVRAVKLFFFFKG